jgi:hypothetical protein
MAKHISILWWIFGPVSQQTFWSVALDLLRFVSFPRNTKPQEDHSQLRAMGIRVALSHFVTWEADGQVGFVAATKRSRPVLSDLANHFVTFLHSIASFLSFDQV